MPIQINASDWLGVGTVRKVGVRFTPSGAWAT